MKKLILSLLSLTTLAAHANEITDKQIKNKFVSMVQDNKVESLLSNSSEFNECREKNKFDPKADPTAKDKALQAATKCFQDKLKGKSGKALDDLATNLQLQNYGLIKSKNVIEITDYLSKKMSKALTGIDPEEKDAEKIKQDLLWKNRTFVDQKVFIDLYINQLGKSALFEISRFCFEDLRASTPADATATDFFGYWGPRNWKTLVATPATVNDLGGKQFFDSQLDTGSKSAMMDTIIKGITKTKMEGDQIEGFFGFCQSAIPTLCEKFKSTTAVSAANTQATSAQGSMTNGATSCLVMGKLQSIRTAMKNTEKVMKQMDEIADQGSKVELLFSDPLKLYERGQKAGEKSLDELTNYGSAEVLGTVKDDKYQDKLKECQGAPDGPGCADYLSVGDGYEKAVHDIDMEMNLKREVELEKMSALKSKPELKKYLEENGYFDLAAESDSLSPKELGERMAETINARKVAIIEGLKKKVGSRQVSEAEYEKMDPNQKKDIVTNNITTAHEEKARMAQVVMFNNIITSHLSLYDKNKKGADGKPERIGRNIGAWKAEEAALKDAKISSASQAYFEGIKVAADKEGGLKSKDTSIVDVGMIDTILGKQEEEKKP